MLPAALLASLMHHALQHGAAHMHARPCGTAAVCQARYGFMRPGRRMRLCAAWTANAWLPALQDNSLLQMPPWSNPWLLAAMALSFGLHFVILYVPALASVFSIVPLSLSEWALVVLFAAPVVLIDEVLKFFGRHYVHRRGPARLASAGAGRESCCRKCSCHEDGLEASWAPSCTGVALAYIPEMPLSLSRAGSLPFGTHCAAWSCGWCAQGFQAWLLLTSS